MEALMSNARLTTKHRKHSTVANSAGHQVVAHKSTGGTLTSIPEPVDPVGNASPHLTNNTVALLSHCELKVRPAARKKRGPKAARLNYYRDAIEVFFSNPQRQAEPIAGHDG
jgi:hypothetical protein